jgi:predicted acyltransferase
VNAPSQPDLASVSKRVLSIDVFRGLTMLVMIFANDLDMAHIRDVPNWMKHASLAVPKIPTDLINHITFVDVISGAFLFIVGAAIPLSLCKRRMKGEPGWQTAGHVLLRTISLLIMGVFMGNMRTKDVVEPIGISHAAWSVLMLLGLTLVWNNYPRAAGWRRGAFVALRITGIALLVGLAIVYRKHSGDKLVGMRLTNWFVLGTIGWAYLVACIVYVLFRRHIASVAACTGLLILIWIADHEGAISKLHLLDGLRRFVSLGNTIGASGSITAAGVMVGMLFTEGSPARTAGRRIQWIAVIGLFAFLAGFMLRPIYGLSRSRNTPSCSLYSIAICCAAYVALYWIIDVKGYRRWTGFTLPAGRNSLIAYFLHYLIHPLSIVLGVEWLNGYLNTGWVGIARTLGVTVVLGIVLTDVLTRLRVRLRL